MGSDRFWKILSLYLTGMLVVMGSANLFFYSELSVSEEKYRNIIDSLDALSYSIDLMINYGNGTRMWHNFSRIPIGFSLYNATMLITKGNMEATYYPQLQSHLVNVINGVGKDEDLDRISWSWIIWHYNEKLSKWVTYEVAADMVYPRNGDKIAWCYQDTSNYPNFDPPK